MEHTQILKDAGFSDKFLEALQEFDKQVPNVFYESPFIEPENALQLVDNNGDVVIDMTNNNYNQNLILTEI